jgi:hypothetical protein
MKIIKSILILLSVAAMATMFDGCNDDNEEPSQAELLIGSWQIVSDVVSECTDPNDNYSETCTSSCETMVISKTEITMDGLTFTYTVNGNTLSINMGSGVTLTVNFVVSGSTLTITLKDSLADGNCKYVATYKKV